MPARNSQSAPVLCDERDANRYVSRVIPPVIFGIFAYASYVVTKPLCVDYLINPRPHHYDRDPRVGTGIAIIVVFYVLLFPTITTYLRLVLVVAFNPDYLPRGADWAPTEPEHESWLSKRRRRADHGNEITTKNNEKRSAAESADIARQTGGVAYPLDENGQEKFWMKDIYVCQDDGRPAYCSKCCQFKTDRAHHNRDADRCVRKLDHFCPWVGGVVSESSFKFFLQFVIYTAFFTCFCLIVLAIFVAEHRSDTGRVNAQWVVALGLAALFFLFSGGMSGTSLQLASLNTTTIENLSRRSKVWMLAIYISPQQYQRMTNRTSGPWALTFPTVTFPTQPPPVPSTTPGAPSSEAEPQSNGVASTAPNNTNNANNTNQPTDMRMFAILRTQPGENPFDLGDPIKNLQQVMGNTLWDWLLPLRIAPCVDHSSIVSAYPMGSVVDRLKREAGILFEDDEGEGGNVHTHQQAAIKHQKREHGHETQC
ncbi:DHHC zinc finger membrane protein [Talaromyces stipitatus ATCC 10500]|uniref:Palmitoyltransferase n=1 Tax=Talaromyces stipitatus (strain ATCC 10500 / CBS 375.48 / QM 6759 / NRRL 1006) TaxID=441959 RepID=B8MCZ6_TALSN|nr:DHHC zinc finger membrane protein [Talaromyces stipitatus ATCC 10500]EED17522.1 DHHC zinc finger membrane protein [Talaromyces stipitatus ATCC 10500]